MASLTKGIWFVHNDGINTIKIYGSNTGNEKIYLNDNLISDKRNMSPLRTVADCQKWHILDEVFSFRNSVMPEHAN